MICNGIDGKFLNLIMYSQVMYCVKCENGGYEQLNIIMSGLDGDYEIGMVAVNYIHESFKLGHYN